MDFLVKFEINVPKGTPGSEVTARKDLEPAAAAKLARQGHLTRLWKRQVAPPARADRSVRSSGEIRINTLL